MARPFEINGARVLVTGASGGLGGALAQRFAGEGAQLILTGRRRDVLESLAASLGGEVVVADLAKPDGPAALLRACGRVDVLVAAAAHGGSGRLVVADPDELDRSLAVNLRAPIMLARSLAPQMSERRSGHIAFIGSLQSKAATAGATIYCATKFGLRGFALALRPELARSGVGVSLILPGFISDAGMFADSGVRLPRGVGTRSPDQVADSVIAAIRQNRAEVEVAPLLLRAGTTIASLAPELAARGVRLLGGERIAAEFERSSSR